MDMFKVSAFATHLLFIVRVRIQRAAGFLFKIAFLYLERDP